MSRAPSLITLSVVAAILAGCGRPPLRQRCRMTIEHDVERGDGSQIRGVALAISGGELLASWCDGAGTWTRRVSSGGAPLGGSRQIGQGCVAVDVASTPSGFVVASVHPGDLLWGGGEVRVAEVDRKGALQTATAVGTAGYFSEGVSVGWIEGRHAVTWTTGVAGDPHVLLQQGEAPPVRLSSGERNGCCGQIVTAHNRALVVWGEFTVRPERGVVLVAPLAGEEIGQRREVATTAVPMSWPTAVVDSSGEGVTLLYRDMVEEYGREQQLLLSVDGEGQPRGDPRQIGRCDGPTRPVLLRAGENLAAFAVRSWSREWIIGLDRFDVEGERIGAQFHVFFDHVRFTDVDALRVGDDYVLVYGEEHPEVILRTGIIDCW